MIHAHKEMKPKYVIAFLITGILVMLSIIAFSQSTEKVRDQYLKVTGKPTFVAPTVSHAVDFVNKKVWRSTSTTSAQWTEETSQAIRDYYFGVAGPAGPQGPIGLTGPKGDKGDPGRDGVCPPCPPSGGSGTFINPYLKNDFTRIEVAGYPTTATVGSAGINPAVFSGITVSANDNLNWANLQYAIYLNKTTGKPIYSHGNFVGLNKDIIWDWDHYLLNWNGQGTTKLSTYTTAPITVLNRQDATATTWQQMISYTKFCNIQGIEFILQAGQTGMDTQMQNNGTFFNLHFMGGNIGINGNFWINTTCNTINLGEIKTGIKLDAAEYTGAGTTATGNVKNSFLNIHYANATGLGEYVLWLRACESTNIDGIIGEGGHQKMGIYIDGANNLNFRLWMIHNLYGEDCHTNQAPCNGPNEAMIVVRNVISGLVSIDGLKGIYPQMLTNVQATGRLSVIISKLPWFENLGNRLFYTDPTSFEVRYQFYSVQSDYLPIPLSSAFTGKVMTPWWKTSPTQDQPANTFVVY